MASISELERDLKTFERAVKGHRRNLKKKKADRDEIQKQYQEAPEGRNKVLLSQTLISRDQDVSDLQEVIKRVENEIKTIKAEIKRAKKTSKPKQ